MVMRIVCFFLFCFAVFGTANAQFNSNVSDVDDRYEYQTPDVKKVIDNNKILNKNYYSGLKRSLKFSVSGIEGVEKIRGIEEKLKKEIVIYNFSVDSGSGEVFIVVDAKVSTSDIKKILYNSSIYLEKISFQRLVVQ